VFSGFNWWMRERFAGCDPRELTEKMIAEGKLERRIVRGGAIIYKPGEGPGPDFNVRMAKVAEMMKDV
jgi:hypothetical protein